MNRLKKALISFLFLSFVSILLPSPTYAWQYPFRAGVKLDGEWVKLNKPLYVTDFYPGAWAEFENESRKKAQLWYQPNKIEGEYYIGEYSQSHFGDPEVIKKRLWIVKQAGIFPAIHIMNKHVIKKDNNGNFYLADWPIYGIKRNGRYYGDWEVYKEIYLPILKELKLPHTLVLDMWAFSHFVPDDVPRNRFNELWWQEFQMMYQNTRPELNDYRIQARWYVEPVEYKPLYFIYGNNNPKQDNSCSSNNLRQNFLRAAGAPEGTGVNPITGDWLDLHGNFWVTWLSYTPDIVDCLDRNQGQWNIVNFQQAFSLSQADKENEWVEKMDNLGPRYFYGHIHKLHDKRLDSDGRNLNMSVDELEAFISDRAEDKGLEWVSIWNEYAETIVMEPANLMGSPQDSVDPWQNGPVHLNRFLQYKVDVTIPSEFDIAKPDLITGPPHSSICQSCSSGLAKTKGNADCNSKIDLLDFAWWLNVFKSSTNDGEVNFNCQDSDSQHIVNLTDFNVWFNNFLNNF
jgi:hypothetical protein